MIRRVLTVVLVMLVWSVQTIDAATDYGDCTQTPAQDASIAPVAMSVTVRLDRTDKHAPCNAGCICNVFHHASVSNKELVIVPVQATPVLEIADSIIASFSSAPPVRPPDA